MPKTLLLLVVLCASSCVKKGVVPDPSVAHRLAVEADVEAWVRAPDGRLVKTLLRVPRDSWVVPPALMAEPLPPEKAEAVGQQCAW